MTVTVNTSRYFQVAIKGYCKEHYHTYPPVGIGDVVAVSTAMTQGHHWCEVTDIETISRKAGQVYYSVTFTKTVKKRK